MSCFVRQKAGKPKESFRYDSYTVPMLLQSEVFSNQISSCILTNMSGSVGKFKLTLIEDTFVDPDTSVRTEIHLGSNFHDGSLCNLSIAQRQNFLDDFSFVRDPVVCHPKAESSSVIPSSDLGLDRSRRVAFLAHGNKDYLHYAKKLKEIATKYHEADDPSCVPVHEHAISYGRQLLEGLKEHTDQATKPLRDPVQLLRSLMKRTEDILTTFTKDQDKRPAILGNLFREDYISGVELTNTEAEIAVLLSEKVIHEAIHIIQGSQDSKTAQLQINDYCSRISGLEDTRDKARTACDAAKRKFTLLCLEAGIDFKAYPVDFMEDLLWDVDPSWTMAYLKSYAQSGTQRSPSPKTIKSKAKQFRKKENRKKTKRQEVSRVKNTQGGTSSLEQKGSKDVGDTESHSYGNYKGNKYGKQNELDKHCEEKKGDGGRNDENSNSGNEKESLIPTNMHVDNYKEDDWSPQQLKTQLLWDEEVSDAPMKRMIAVDQIPDSGTPPDSLVWKTVTSTRHNHSGQGASTLASTADTSTRRVLQSDGTYKHHVSHPMAGRSSETAWHQQQENIRTSSHRNPPSIGRHEGSAPSYLQISQSSSTKITPAQPAGSGQVPMHNAKPNPSPWAPLPRPIQDSEISLDTKPSCQQNMTSVDKGLSARSASDGSQTSGDRRSHSELCLFSIDQAEVKKSYINLISYNHTSRQAAEHLDPPRQPDNPAPAQMESQMALFDDSVEDEDEESSQEEQTQEAFGQPRSQQKVVRSTSDNLIQLSYRATTAPANDAVSDP